MKTKLLVFLFLVIGSNLTAQTNSIKNETMADLMRSNGKIYVVVAVVATILIGLIAYMIRVEKKISTLEKDLKK
jgi:uncharacterized membrane protein